MLACLISELGAIEILDLDRFGDVKGSYKLARVRHRRPLERAHSLGGTNDP